MIMENFDTNKNTIDKQGNLRVYFLFSYWIFFWFLIFYFTQNVRNSDAALFIQKNMNPKIGLYFALFENIATFLYIILFRTEFSVIIKYLLMIFSVKILPIYLIKQKIHLWNDLFVFIFIFCIYIIYLWINDETIYSVYKRTFEYVKSGQNKTPFFYLFEKIKSLIIPLLFQ